MSRRHKFILYSLLFTALLNAINHLLDRFPMEIKYKKLHPLAHAPMQMSSGAAGFDLVATDYDTADNQIIYYTGLAIEIPAGHIGLLYPRSSIIYKDLYLTNSVGIIDSDYRGHVKMAFNIKPEVRVVDRRIYEKGERIGQLIIMPIPTVRFVEAKELSETKRGDGGYGSTGK